MKRDRDDLLRDALAHFEVMDRYAAQDTNDQLVIDAICMRLSAGLDVLADLDAQIRAELFAGQWSLMWGMRNRVAPPWLQPRVKRSSTAYPVKGWWRQRALPGQDPLCGGRDDVDVLGWALRTVQHRGLRTDHDVLNAVSLEHRQDRPWVELLPRFLTCRSCRTISGSGLPSVESLHHCLHAHEERGRRGHRS